MTQLYRGMDRAALDREYDARATVPDIAPFLAAYRSGTAAARRDLPCRIGLAYGPTEPERLDLYPAARPAARPGPAPVFLYIHGGYWRLLDAADSGFMAPFLTRAGACVAVLNYALAPAVTLDEIVRQCRAALAWLRANVAAQGGDPARIHVAGSSAGGHLAAMLASAEPCVAGATLLSGLYDLEPLRHCHVHDWLRLDAAAAARNSPALLPPPRVGLPLVFSAAATETGEFLRQTAGHAARCAAAGCAVTTVAPPPGSNHFDLPLQLCADTPLSRAVRAAMGLG